MSLLYIIAFILLIIATHQLLRIIEISRSLKKTNEWEVKISDNDTMGKSLLLFLFLFFCFFFWQLYQWSDKALPASASEHGDKVDALLKYNFYLIIFIFLVTNAFLFYFAYKYRGRKGQNAVYYAHNNKLEMLWTIIPASALAFIITYGLLYWNEITEESKSQDKIVVEFYAKQFDWTARFPGKDGKLGTTDYRQISGSNSVGMDTNDVAGNDDILVKNEILLPVNKEIVLEMRSRDVIHSAFLPHFRAQMNCVPGMVTTFKFKPTKTTEEMRKDPYVVNLMKGINKQREKKGEEPVEFDYTLLCNKICGASHYNMGMTIKIVSEKEYNEWLAKQKPFKTVAQK
jgi:cytochrome c oxidase subunit 2